MSFIELQDKKMIYVLSEHLLLHSSPGVPGSKDYILGAGLAPRKHAASPHGYQSLPHPGFTTEAETDAGITVIGFVQFILGAARQETIGGTKKSFHEAFRNLLHKPVIYP